MSCYRYEVRALRSCSIGSVWRSGDELWEEWLGLEVEVEEIRSWKWKVEVKGLEMKVVEDDAVRVLLHVR